MGMRCCVWLSETGVGTLPGGGIHHMGDRSHLTPQSQLTVAEFGPGTTARSHNTVAQGQRAMQTQTHIVIQIKVEKRINIC